jgi:hypothetical protein
MRPNQRKALGRGEGRSAGVVVPLASLSLDGLDCSSGSLGAPLCLAPRCVQVQPAPGGVLAVLVEPSLAATQPAATHS